MLRIWVQGASVLLVGGAALGGEAALAAGPEALLYRGHQVVHSRYDEAGGIDLLSAGLGAAGIASAEPPLPADPLDPTPQELRTLAIYNNTRALVDPSEAGGFGRLYGPGVPLEPGTSVPEFIYGDEFLVFSNRFGLKNVTLMVQVPDSFDPAQPCIITGTSSGSRGVYGAIGTSGEWGLKQGCAVAYTDKGTGTGAHHLQDDDVYGLRGELLDADGAGDEATFVAPISEATRARFNQETPNRYAFKHAHSLDNPERAWGLSTLDAIEFAFVVLNEAIRPARFPGAEAFVPDNTIVIASSVSNGGGGALLAAEQDDGGLIDGVAVSEPNINPTFDDGFAIVQGDGPPLRRHSRPLYDYVTLKNVLQGCANLAPDVLAAPLNLVPAELGEARCASLADKGLIEGDTLEEQALDAQAIINAAGILEEQNFVAPSFWFLNVSPAVAVTYASAYGRLPVQRRLCDFGFGATDAATGEPVPPAEATEALLFANSSGIPPTGGINLINEASASGPLENRVSISPTTGRTDQNLDGALCLRALWLGADPVTGDPLTGIDERRSERVRAGIEEVLASGDLGGRPAIITHGRSDPLIHPNHSSRAYYGLNQLVDGADSQLSYIEVTNAQHLDAVIPLFPTTFVPLHHYFLEALDLVYAHLAEGAPLPPSQVVRTEPRAEGEPLSDDNLPPITLDPGDAQIRFENGEVRIPD